MRRVDPVGFAKAILWEEAKGKLRAIVAAEGAQSSAIRLEGMFPFEKTSAVVERFITEFEEAGLHE